MASSWRREVGRRGLGQAQQAEHMMWRGGMLPQREVGPEGNWPSHWAVSGFPRTDPGAMTATAGGQPCPHDPQLVVLQASWSACSLSVKNPGRLSPVSSRLNSRTRFKDLLTNKTLPRVISHSPPFLPTPDSRCASSEEFPRVPFMSLGTETLRCSFLQPLRQSRAPCCTLHPSLPAFSIWQRAVTCFPGSLPWWLHFALWLFGLPHKLSFTFDYLGCHTECGLWLCRPSLPEGSDPFLYTQVALTERWERVWEGVLGERGYLKFL